MRAVRRDPDTGYVSENFWVPKKYIPVDSTKAALTFSTMNDRTQRFLTLWKETDHHLIIPREFWNPETQDFPVVDCRPRTYSETRVKSRIQLDFKSNFRETVQRDAVRAMQESRGGILQLACVTGDTVLNLNRAGKGFKMTIADAYERMHGGKYAWDLTTPTFTRAAMNGQIGLHRVIDVVYRGKRRVYKVTLEDGKSIRLTDDHQFLTPTGFRSLAEGLVAGEEVLVDGKRGTSIKKPKVAYKRIAGFDHHPYARPQTRSVVIEEHRAVVEAEMNGVTLETFRELCRRGDIDGLKFINPDKFHVHHRDENPKNNHLDNLEVLPREDHLKGHRPGAAAFGYGVPTPVKIKSIDPDGIEDVYDVVCDDPHHNFVANGIVVHNCGKGKTVCALELIARMGVPAMIIVDNTQLVDQWLKEIGRHLDVPGGVGHIQAGKFDWKKSVVIATYTTIANLADEMTEEVRRWFGLVIWDEAHHMAAPTWMKGADLFPCKRIGLTATPTRVDGMHVVYDFHIGPVLYKDLTQELKPEIFFQWTGLEVDVSDPKVKAKVCDVNGELHTSMLASYFGQWRPRLDFILSEVRKAAAAGRKILVLSYSVAELVNMLAIWNNDTSLYTDIPDPTPQDVGETLQPQELDERTIRRLHRKIGELNTLLGQNPAVDQRKGLEMHKTDLLHRLKQHEVWKKIESEREKRQKAYVKNTLVKHYQGSAGLMIADVKVKERTRMLAEKQVTFAIMKYGREGLDEQSLDTVFVCEPMSQKNALQQLMGRVLRIKAGKKQPIVMFFEDNIGPMIGMCQNLRRHLNTWPLEEGGPFTYTLVGHPRKGRGRTTWGMVTA